MSSRRATVGSAVPCVLVVALVAGAGAFVGSARAAGGPAEPWYDASPLVSSIRSDARAGLAGALGVSRLEDLTLYDLDVSYEPRSASFGLTEEVWFTNTTGAPLSDLVFRVYTDAAPPPTGPLVHFVSGACLDRAPCGFSSPSASAIRVQPPGPLAPGDRLHLSLTFRGNLTRIDSSRTNLFAQGLEGLTAIFGGADGSGATGGAAGGDYGILGIGDGIASFGNFYAVLARRTGAGWETNETSKLGDLGSDRMASFRARIELPAHAKLGVTGTVTSEQPVAGHPERREVRVVAAAIRDFAFLFGDALESSERTVLGTRVRSLFLGADRAAGAHALDAAAHALEDFERRFGPYPYADFTVSEAAIVGGAGGVEFSGLVTAASMFYRPMDAGGSGAGHDAELAALLGQLGQLGGGGAGMTDGMLEFVVAHEVAHQWWHGLVGSDSRDHPYVDESLAQYSAILYLQDRYGAARADKDGDLNAKMNFQTMRMLGTPDAPADRPVASFVSTVQYAGVVYGKAPYFYKAARASLGDAAFFGALRAYTAKYRFREAPARGLADLLAAAGGDAKMRPLERRWLDEMHGDDDLGKLDLGGALGGILGGGVDSGEMDEVMKLLGSSGGLSVPTTAAPAGSSAPGAPAPKLGDPDLEKLLKDFGGGP